MDNLGRFYTEQRISRLLISSIVQPEPKYVLDLGVGRGSLLRAAYERWGKAEFLGTEIDQNGIGEIKKELPFACLFRADGLSCRLPSALKLRVGSIDVAICNPPYQRVKPTRDIRKIFEKAGLQGCWKLPTVTSDIVFLAQNIQMLREGGELGIILPDSLLTGHNFSVLRELLLVRHRVLGIIQLPDKIFSRTEARTHILLLRKGEDSYKQSPSLCGGLFRRNNGSYYYSNRVACQKDGFFLS